MRPVSEGLVTITSSVKGFSATTDVTVDFTGSKVSEIEPNDSTANANSISDDSKLHEGKLLGIN